MENTLALPAVLALREIISRGDFQTAELPEGSAGATGYIENGNRITPGTTGHDANGRPWAHFGYFLVERLDNGRPSGFSNKGHFVPFARYSKDDSVVVAVCNDGGCTGGSVSPEMLEGFYRAMRNEGPQTVEPYTSEYTGIRHATRITKLDMERARSL